MNDELSMNNEEIRMKNEVLLEQYLAGNAPLHADRLNLPSDKELDAAEAEFDEILAARKKTALHIPLWPWAVGIAAAFVIAFILWPKAVTEDDATPLAINETPKVQEHEQEEQSLMAQQAEPEHPIVVKKKESRRTPKGVDNSFKKGIGVDEPLEEKIAGLTIVPTSADLGPGVKMRLGDPCLITDGKEPVPQEDVSPIPAGKQALADIYLAEMALQVAYERQAQAEALRAYAASLTGEEIPKAIIAY